MSDPFGDPTQDPSVEVEIERVIGGETKTYSSSGIRRITAKRDGSINAAVLEVEFTGDSPHPDGWTDDAHTVTFK